MPRCASVVAYAPPVPRAPGRAPGLLEERGRPLQITLCIAADAHATQR